MNRFLMTLELQVTQEAQGAGGAGISGIVGLVVLEECGEFT